MRRMALNPHHLELFHYVARFGGIAQASKRMPYGVGQPAISLQISRLEGDLGVTLFRRRPFRLTPEGERLAAHIEPFFRGLERIETELRGGAAPLLRVGAAEIVQREHLPGVLAKLRERHPALRLALRDAPPDACADLIRAGELDAAVFMSAEAPPADLKFEPLATARLCLLVPEGHPARKAGDVLDAERIAAPLVCLPPQEPAARAFRAVLGALGRVWEPSLELSTQALVNRYVADGYGVGLGVSGVGAPAPKGLRELPVPDSPALTIGVLHAGNLNPVRDAFVALAAAAAPA